MRHVKAVSSLLIFFNLFISRTISVTASFAFLLTNHRKFAHRTSFCIVCPKGLSFKPFVCFWALFGMSAVNFASDYNFKRKIRTILKSSFKGKIRRKTTTLVSIRLAFLGARNMPRQAQREEGKISDLRRLMPQWKRLGDWEEAELCSLDHNKPGRTFLSHRLDGWTSAVWQTKSHNLAAVCRGMLHRWTLAFACQRTHGSDAVEIQIPSHQFHHNHYPISLKETTILLQSQPKHCPVTISTHCPKHHC